MKKLLFLMLFFSAYSSYGQKVLARVNCVLTRTDNTNDSLHAVANEFSNIVGDLLKQYYPAFVENVKVSLTCEDDSMTLRYTCDIVEASKECFHYYFDHRGGLSFKKTIDEAKSNAKRRSDIQANTAYDNFKKTYGSACLTVFQDNYHDDSKCRTRAIAVHEYFIAARGPLLDEPAQSVKKKRKKR